ncbi:putative squalene-hopene-cyclase [Lophiostoma macrostomum CBS 122681]|uniref:Terpene cyclase/mutase family member n=1 Tax=Lophiostoma macrostomum CBS 122681 TaxID=1314788 RepID=A0A6A6SZX2_9PLEO|nr:putative squalene-hopene-cyclase [Lophiostoma macrostomum CBS 122681]
MAPDITRVDSPLKGVYDDAPQAIKRAINSAWDLFKADSHWQGELKSNTAITAQQIFFYQSLGVPVPDASSYRKYLLSQQQDDGSWSIAPDYPGDISISSETYLALKLLGVSSDDKAMRHAREFIRNAGGVAKVRIFTRIFFAQFGLFPWSAVPQLPAEFIFLPSILPINIYRLSSWARSTLIPLFIIRHHERVYALPNGLHANNSFLDELWLDPEHKDVPYGPSLLKPTDSDSFSLFFSFVDTALSYLGSLRPLWMFRGLARRKCIRWILDHQEKEGDWAGIIPPMHGGVQALLLEGYTLQDDCVRRGIEGIERFTCHDDEGKRLQSCVSPVWDTVLMTRALCEAGVDRDDVRIRGAIKWIKSKQILTDKGDWRIFSRSSEPGGFSFEYHNDWYPDVDDTAAAILALVTHDPVAVGCSTVSRAANWICGMQNEDGGWGAFDIGNNKLWLNKIPFSDMDALCDPSSADVTGRILEAFGLMMKTAESEYVEPQLIGRISMTCPAAIKYLVEQQETSGAWYGRWGCNYLYGTSNVICGLVYFSEGDEQIQAMLSDAARWLKETQNEDGGWGEDLLSYRDPSRAGKGVSTPSQTAWALMGLLTTCDVMEPAIVEGVNYLMNTQTDVQGNGASWLERRYTGTGFPNHFYIGYSYYRHYFPLMVLGRVARAAGAL